MRVHLSYLAVVAMAGKHTSYVDTLPPDVRKRYDSKTAYIKCDPYGIAMIEWEKDASKGPLIGFLDVINYLVYSPSGYTSEQLKKYKSLEAYKFYQDGLIDTPNTLQENRRATSGASEAILLHSHTFYVSESFRLGLSGCLSKLAYVM